MTFISLKKNSKVSQNKGVIPEKFSNDNLDYKFSENLSSSIIMISGGIGIFLVTFIMSKLLH